MCKEPNEKEVARSLRRWTILLAVVTILLLAAAIVNWVTTFSYSKAALDSSWTIENAEQSINRAIQDLPGISTELEKIIDSTKYTDDNLTTATNTIVKVQNDINDMATRIRYSRKLDVIRHRIDYFESDAIPNLKQFQVYIPTNLINDLNSVLYDYNQAEDALYAGNYQSTENWINYSDKDYQKLSGDYLAAIGKYLSPWIQE